MAKVIWCKSSARLNSTGTTSRALRPGLAGLHHFGQALAVVGVQLFNAHMQTGERLAVRR